MRCLLEVKAALLSGQTRGIEYSQMTISQWFELWFETHTREWEITTQKMRRLQIDKHIKPLLGKYKLNQLDKATYIRMFINELSSKFKPNTVLSIHNTFKIAINAAVDDEILLRNRFKKIVIEQDQKLDNYLTPKELVEFLSIVKKVGNETNYTMVLLLAYTGLRKGEALGLKWKNINFKDKTITVERTRDYSGTRSPKTKRSNRTILIDDILVNHLKTYQKWCVETKFSYGMKLDKKDDYVLISYFGGEPMGRDTINNFFHKVYKHTDLRKITPHGLRHTHATILISERIPTKVIAERLGNTVQMVYDVYAHTFKELEEESVIAFSESLNSGAKLGAK